MSMTCYMFIFISELIKKVIWLKYVFGSGSCVLRLHFFSFFFFFPHLLLRTHLRGQTSTIHEQQPYIVNFSASFISLVGPIYSAWDLQTSLFSNFFIKNVSHNTIHTFKIYFAIIFSVFSFIKISTIQTDPKELDNKFGIKKNIITATKKAEADPSMPLYMSYYSVFDKCCYKP